MLDQDKLLREIREEIAKKTEARKKQQGFTLDANVKSKNTASDSENGSSEPQSWGDLFNNTLKSLSKFTPMGVAAPVDEEKYKTYVESQRKPQQPKRSAGYEKDKKAFIEELNKSFGPAGSFLGAVIDNPTELTLEDRKNSGDVTPEEYLLDIVTKQIGGINRVPGATPGVKFDLGPSLSKQKMYPNLTESDIQNIISEKFYEKLKDYKDTKESNLAIAKSKDIDDISEWLKQTRASLINAYKGLTGADALNFDIATLVETLHHTDLNQAEFEKLNKDLLDKKSQKKILLGSDSNNTGMLYNLQTRELTEKRPDTNQVEGFVDLGVQEKQAILRSLLEQEEPQNQLDFLENQFETKALALAEHNEIIDEEQEWSIINPAFAYPGGASTVLDRRGMLTAESQKSSGARITISSTTRDLLNNYKDLDPVPLNEFNSSENKDNTVKKWQAKMNTLKQNDLDFNGEFQAIKRMYLLNEGLEDIVKPEYFLAIPENVEAFKQTVKAFVKPWTGDYYATELLGTTAREDIQFTDKVYDNLGIEKTKKEEEQTEESIGELVNTTVVGMNKMLVEFALMNKGLAVAGVAAKIAQVNQALTAGRWVRNGRIISNASMTSRARAAGMTRVEYAKKMLSSTSKVKKFKKVKGGFEGYRFIPASNSSKALSILNAGLVEGIKFEAFTQFDITKLELKPEAGERFGFFEGFGFGAAGRILAPLSPLLAKKGVLKDINLRGFGANSNIGVSTKALFEFFVTQPASFVVGSQAGGLVDAVVQDALGHKTFKNFIDEKYGHHDEIGRELIVEYLTGLGLGGIHFKGFNNFKSSKALMRARNRELQRMREAIRKDAVSVDAEGKTIRTREDLFDQRFKDLKTKDSITIEDLNNLFDPAVMQKIHSSLSAESLKKFYDAYEMYDVFTRKYIEAERAKGYLNPAVAEELVRKDHKDFLAREDKAGKQVRIEVVNNKNLKFGQKPIAKNRAAEIETMKGGGSVIRYNAEMYSPDIMVHEVHHYYTEDLFSRDAVFKAEFMVELNKVAEQIELSNLITEAQARELGDLKLVGEKMNLAQAIKLEKFDLTSTRNNIRISQWELFAHIAQRIGNKKNYSSIGKEGFVKLKQLLSTLGRAINGNSNTSKKLNLSTQEQVVKWFRDYAANVKKGKSVVDLFSELKEVIDVEATKITKQQRELFDTRDSKSLASRDLNAEKQVLMRTNETLRLEKPEGYEAQVSKNIEEIKKLNENIKRAERNATNIDKYKNSEEGSVARERAMGELMSDNMGIISEFIKSEFKPGLDVSREEFEAETMLQFVKIVNRYNPEIGQFGGYLQNSLGGKHTTAGFSQQGNIIKAAQAGRRTEVAMSELGGDFNIESIADTDGLPSGGNKTVEAGGVIGKRVEDTLKWTESDVAEKIDNIVRDKDINYEGYVYKDLKSEVAGVELVQRTSKTGKTNLVRPTKSSDVKATGGLVEVLDVVAKEFGIENVSRVLADQDLTTKMRDAAREYIYKNREALKEAMPEAETPSGIATGIFNTNLAPMYIEVSARGKSAEGRTTAGKAVVNKRKNFDTNSFLRLFNINPDGSIISFNEGLRRGKVDATIRELIKQIAVIGSNQSIRKQYPGKTEGVSKYENLGVGKSEAMASMVLDKYMEAFPEKSFAEAQDFFYNAYIGNLKDLSSQERNYLRNLKRIPGLTTRQQALLYGMADALAMGGKTRKVNFEKDLQIAKLEDIILENGEKITAEEIKAINLKANFRMVNGNVVVNNTRTNIFVDHSVKFSELLPKVFTKNLGFFQQAIFLHQRSTLEGVTEKTQKGRVERGKEKILSEEGNSIVNERYTKGRERALESVGKNTLLEVWEDVILDFTKATAQVTGQKKYTEAKTEAERTKIIEKYFSQLSEANKVKIYDALASTMEYYVHSGKNKAEVLSRMEWAANAMRSNSNLRLGLRQLAPILAIYKGSGKMTDAIFKLEHAKVSVRQSLTAFELISQNKWRQYGAETLADFVGILSPKKLLDIIDAKGGTTNMTALYRMAILEPSTLAEFVTVESGGKQTLLDYVLKRFEADVKAKQNLNKESKRLEANRKILKQQGLLADPKTGEHLASKILDNIDKAMALGRKKNKKPSGMATFDFDETLIVEGENFVVARRGNEEVKISSAEWPIKGPEFAEKGYEFDFSDFANVRGGKEGPLLQKMKNLIAKYGAKDVFVLTARQQASAEPIHKWLKSQGIDIPLENITGLGRSEGEAKAQWMLEKFAEGYNDMYFVDDALPNVKAVKKVLDQLDIKSNVQQALASKDLSGEINNIMKHSLNIAPEKTFSKAEGKIRGADIKRRRLFMTDGAADFELLLEPLYGKGSEGVKNQEWFKENIIKPFERGYNDLNNAKQKATNEYMELRKQNKDIVKSLDKEIAGTSFTTDMAMRIYIWNKNGIKIPDLAKSTENKLVNEIKNNPKLLAFVESVARITGIEGGLKEPTADWWTGTIAGEISGLSEGVSRSKYLAEFIDAKNEIFSEENLNKMESKLGTNWRRNLEDMLDRMETGRTRSANLGEGGNAIMDYLNGSVGTIMNLNTRSAMLQLISSVNFINHSFNNPLAATRAFANQPQYWKDFMYIMNSDMLVQRRNGLRINVTEAELAAAASGSKNPAKAVIAKILKAGYIPTKIADSFAIASGGATYYRNAIRKYMKEGLSKAEAEKKAFIDFQAIAERTQQSSRPDLLSAQQVSVAGRIILPFANTPMQMNRIMMKELLDLKNGRYKGTFGDNSISNKMSKVAYYGFVQSAIFAGLQSGLYALTAFGDDKELQQQKKVYAVNTMADSFLRGMGIQGAVMAGIKNAALEFQTQNNKGFGADYSEVGEDLLNISPTIGSKFTKMDAAGNTYKYNKKKILDEGLTLDGPAMQGLTMAVEAIGNVPVNRLYRKIENIRAAMDDQNETYQRVLVGLGWSKWDVGIGQKERAEEKAKEKIQKEKEKKARRCFQIKSDGTRCKNTAKAGERYCYVHK